jgi:NDP-sugar pyrophosphorylase family protein
MAYPFSGKWLDIGVPADYERAQEEFEQHRECYWPSKTETKE